MSLYYRLWTLNASTVLLENQKKKFQKIYGSYGSWGQRSHVNVGPPSNTNALMYEELHEATGRKDYDEYFVPIVVKCLGRYLLWDNHIIKKLKEPYGENAQAILDQYWITGLDNKAHEKDSLTRMNTKDNKGYYEILLEDSIQFEKNHPGDELRHVLIGYSQGGLVALFLAWIDENLFDKQIIESICVFQTPVLGSPLANPDNKLTVSQGFSDILFSILGLYHTDPGLMMMYDEALEYIRPKDGSVDSMIRTLDMLGIALKADLDNDDNNGLRMENHLLNFRKWISGLKGEIEYAFSDLNSSNLLDPYSVLSLVNHHKFEKVKIASITGASSSLSDIVETSMKSKKLKLSLLIISPVLSLGHMLGIHLMRYINVFGKTLEANMQRAEFFYSTKVLRDCPHEDNELILRAERERKNRMNQGRGIGDLIIPVSYQSTKHIQRSHPTLEWENPWASHYTGFRPNTLAGKANIKTIYRFLKRMHRLK
ncbi:hypothetical protein [Spirochaeta cellobiosiphila]|uniref:hypothetical protein n=1 Tax=Spirochaeta cellobiosiphila TaxID=504483 RepID=UPI00040D22E9|nr:hypothetical protein [Spirochaeta cellobiosiphila]